jgi:hypothetical protein
MCHPAPASLALNCPSGRRLSNREETDTVSYNHITESKLTQFITVTSGRIGNLCSH